MSNLTLEFIVNGQRIFFPEQYNVVADSKNYLCVKFKFSPDWNNSPKFALFYTSNLNAPPIEVQLKKDWCYVPEKVIAAPCFFISLYTVTKEKRITTEKLKIPVLRSGFSEETVPPILSDFNTVSVHSPAGNKQVAQIREDGGIMEYSKDGDKWNRLKNGFIITIGAFFQMQVDDNSDLWVIMNDGGENPMEYDEETGNLYYVIGGIA